MEDSIWVLSVFLPALENLESLYFHKPTLKDIFGYLRINQRMVSLENPSKVKKYKIKYCGE